MLHGVCGVLSTVCIVCRDLLLLTKKHCWLVRESRSPDSSLVALKSNTMLCESHADGIEECVGKVSVGNEFRRVRKHILLPVEHPFYHSVEVGLCLQDGQSPVEMLC